jgi:hypothetical protein
MKTQTIWGPHTDSSRRRSRGTELRARAKKPEAGRGRRRSGSIEEERDPRKEPRGRGGRQAGAKRGAMDAAMDLMRRMPPGSADTALNALLQLLPDHSLDLLSQVDLPLQVRSSSSVQPQAASLGPSRGSVPMGIISVVPIHLDVCVAAFSVRR